MYRTTCFNDLRHDSFTWSRHFQTPQKLGRQLQTRTWHKTASIRRSLAFACHLASCRPAPDIDLCAYLCHVPSTSVDRKSHWTQQKQQWLELRLSHTQRRHTYAKSVFESEGAHTTQKDGANTPKVTLRPCGKTLEQNRSKHTRWIGQDTHNQTKTKDPFRQFGCQVHAEILNSLMRDAVHALQPRLSTSQRQHLCKKHWQP